ncbi:flagellar hook-associated protein 2 [Spirochaetia bacterium]|nr:flagellar hook-associated protein 2 [Spirochaetia bacterium]
MSDIYVPGVKSRFNTESIIEGLMKVERVPRDRVESTIDTLKSQKTYWQDVGRRISSLRDSARLLFSFQNPFSDRIVVSGDDSVISGTATREAVEQNRTFKVTQAAQADRFLSSPLEESFKVEAGTYTYLVGEREVSLSFRGGSLKEFTDALNRRGPNLIKASTITVERGTKSLLIESLVTGSENRLGFSGDAESLAIKTGMIEQVNTSNRDIALGEDRLTVAAGGSAAIPVSPALRSESGLVLQFETATAVKSDDAASVPQPPSGPALPGAGSVTYGGITIENDLSSVALPEWQAPEPPQRVDNMAVLSLSFSDGSTATVPAIKDSKDFARYQYQLGDIAGTKTINSINLVNTNTHRDISIQNIRIFDPEALGGYKPLQPVSTAQDAIVAMDGIQIKRPSNTIDDLVPGVSLTVKGASEKPVKLGVVPDRESIKDAVISLVANYNRLMAEVNVLTRNDETIITELSYLSSDEQESLRERMGVFSGDTTLNQFKSALQRAMTAPYPTTTDQDLSMLAQIGIGTDVRRAGASSGYDAARLRGYLEIDEKVLDEALETKLPAIQQLFGLDTDGDLIVDSGIAYAMDRLAQPYVQTGGLITLKTGTIDSKISQDQKRIETMDRQLAAKEATLKSQYSQMESAYSRMESMSTSLDNFSQQSNANTNR